MTQPVLRWDYLGRLRYGAALARQHALRDAVLAGAAEPALLLCEHEPVITLGRSARADSLLASPEELRRLGVDVVAIERGGDVTYHGPGQLMIYPIIPVRSVLAFLTTVAGVLAALCAELGVPDARFQDRPAGLWLGPEKLAACGLHLRRGVVLHGWAFNVATPAERWRPLRPCGGDAPQLSLSEARQRVGLPPLSVVELAAELGPRLARALPAVMRGG